MNILMLAPLPPPTGGMASWAKNYMSYCEKNNISMQIVNIGIRGRRAQNEHCKTSVIDEVIRTVNIICNLRSKLRGYKADVIHMNTSCQTMGVVRDLLIMLFIPRRIPVVLHCHCNIEDQLGKKQYSKFAFQLLVNRADKVMVLNNSSRQYIEQIKPNSVSVVPNFIGKISKPQSHVIKDSVQEIIYVGHVEEAKGVCEILDSARQLPNIHFTLVGAIRSDLSAYEITDNVTLVGRVSEDEVKTFLSKADIFLFPSKSEGFSIALLEAMQMGLPVIASDVGANKDMIEDNGGIILEENTCDAIINAILKLSDKDIRIKMSCWNYDRVVNTYIEDVVIKKYFGIYESVIR